MASITFKLGEKTRRQLGEKTLLRLFIYNDFSAGPRERLKASTEYAYAGERTQSLLKASLAENVKKGWDKPIKPIKQIKVITNN